MSAQAGETLIVSVGPGGVPANNESWYPAISADGRYVAFSSNAFDLVSNDLNWWLTDIFVRDTLTGTTSLASTSSSGEQGNDSSNAPVLSADGRFVAFTSQASNLVPADTNAVSDVFLHDRWSGATTRVSVHSNGLQADKDSYEAAISADGSWVAFTSLAALTPQDIGGSSIFVHNRITGELLLASIEPSGAPFGSDFIYCPEVAHAASLSGDGRLVTFQVANGKCYDTLYVRDLAIGLTTMVGQYESVQYATYVTWVGGASTISLDGRFVAFSGTDVNLPPSNFHTDVFLVDLLLGGTERISVAPDGEQGSDNSLGRPAISADNRFVTFSSWASNLVPDDSNGTFPAAGNDIFVRDLLLDQTTRISVSTSGLQGDLNAQLTPAISADGRYVAFDSKAGTLTPGGSDGFSDVFLHLRGIWSDIGHGLPGAAGVPELVGAGALTAGKAGSLTLSGAAPTAVTVLFVALRPQPSPFKGGTLVPYPPLHAIPFTTDAAGGLSVPFTWPAQVAADTQLYLQFAIDDPAAPQGVALSNAVLALTP